MAPKASPRKSAGGAAAVATKTATKRGVESSKSAPRAKAPKKCPMLEAIEDVVEKADLSESCRKMVLALVPTTLSTPADKRNPFMTITMDHIEELINTAAAKLQEEIDSENEAVREADAKKIELDTKVSEEQAVLETTEQSLEKAQRMLAEASKEVAEKQTILQQAESAQQEGDKARNAAVKDAEEYQELFEKYFKPLRDESLEAKDAAEYAKALEPLINKLVLDDSLTTTIPGTLGKAPAARGSFENLVMTELGTSLEKYHQDLQDQIALAAPKSEELANEVREAQGARSVAKEKVDELRNKAAELKSSLLHAKNAVTAAKASVEKYRPEYEEAVAVRERKTAAFQHFQTTTIDSFNVFKNNTSENQTPAADVNVEG